jgi:hypothetical protein
MKGNAGFKPAVITKLGGAWINGARDIGQDIVSFSLPGKMQLEDFKESIGNTIISDFEVQFFDELPGDTPSEPRSAYVPGGQIRMSIWANNDSNISVKKSMVSEEGK